MLNQFRYRIWFFFGGWRVEDRFKCLSESILLIRGLVNEVRVEILDIEKRLWELEDHSEGETLEMLSGKVQSRLDSIEKKLKEDKV